jgi:hypothetical protein
VKESDSKQSEPMLDFLKRHGWSEPAVLLLDGLPRLIALWTEVLELKPALDQAHSVKMLRAYRIMRRFESAHYEHRPALNRPAPTFPLFKLLRAKNANERNIKQEFDLFLTRPFAASQDADKRVMTFRDLTFDQLWILFVDRRPTWELLASALLVDPTILLPKPRPEYERKRAEFLDLMSPNKEPLSDDTLQEKALKIFGSDLPLMWSQARAAYLEAVNDISLLAFRRARRHLKKPERRLLLFALFRRLKRLGGPSVWPLGGFVLAQEQVLRDFYFKTGSQTVEMVRSAIGGKANPSSFPAVALSLRWRSYLSFYRTWLFNELGMDKAVSIAKDDRQFVVASIDTVEEPKIGEDESVNRFGPLSKKLGVEVLPCRMECEPVKVKVPERPTRPPKPALPWDEIKQQLSAKQYVVFKAIYNDAASLRQAAERIALEFGGPVPSPQAAKKLNDKALRKLNKAGIVITPTS